MLYMKDWILLFRDTRNIIDKRAFRQISYPSTIFDFLKISWKIKFSTTEKNIYSQKKKNYLIRHVCLHHLMFAFVFKIWREKIFFLSFLFSKWQIFFFYFDNNYKHNWPVIYFMYTTINIYAKCFNVQKVINSCVTQTWVIELWYG